MFGLDADKFGRKRATEEPLNRCIRHCRPGKTTKGAGSSPVHPAISIQAQSAQHWAFFIGRVRTWLLFGCATGGRQTHRPDFTDGNEPFFLEDRAAHWCGIDHQITIAAFPGLQHTMPQ